MEINLEGLKKRAANVAYSYDVFSRSAPAISPGGFIGTPAGPMGAALSSKCSWFRMPDEVQRADESEPGLFKRTITWIGRFHENGPCKSKVNLAEIFNAEMDAVPARGAGGPVKAPWTRLSASSNNPAKDRMRASWIEIMTGGAPWWKQT